MQVCERNVAMRDAAGSTPRQAALIVTSYRTGADTGRNLGTAGYSYDFVARLFEPLLRRWGKLIEIRDASRELEPAIAQARREGFVPIHLSFLPFQDTRLSPSALNVVVPAWEFPDIPNHMFDGNPQNDWVKTANRCNAVIVGGPFTREALQRAGVSAPIHIVQVPTPTDYFQIPDWHAGQSTTLQCDNYLFSHDSIGIVGDNATSADRPRSRPDPWQHTVKSSIHKARRVYKRTIRRLVPRRLDKTLAEALRAAAKAWKFNEPPKASQHSSLNLRGIVYTSIFNPYDGRKNWEDLLTGFLLALQDCEDATLAIKLITNHPNALHDFLLCYSSRGIKHRCRLVVIPGYLTDEQMLQLTEASTYYITTTRAEGNCIPLMNYLAAGRPAVSPSHTAISDYFQIGDGFVVDSHPEPAAWPQDSRLRSTTSWHRLVWPSLAEQIRLSYEMATRDPGAYQSLATQGRQKMSAWADYKSVWTRLDAALNAVLQLGDSHPAEGRGANIRKAA